MSIYVNSEAIMLFDPMPKQAYQAKGFKLRNATRSRTNVIGSQVRFVKVGQGMAQQKAVQDDVVPLNLTYSHVTLTLQDWHASDYSDIFGQKEINFDEMNELSMALGMAIGRRSDQQIIDALKNSATANTIAAGAVGFTYEKFLEMNEFFTKNNIRNEGSVFHVVIDATAEKDLLAEIEFTSSDFTHKAVMDNGGSLDGLQMFGYMWHVIGNMTEGGIPVVSTTHSSFAWEQKAIGLGIGLDFATEVNYIPTKTSFLVTSKFKANAIAIDPIGIVQIDYI